jgi:HEPN domain-containing protein
MGLKFSFRP